MKLATSTTALIALAAAPAALAQSAAPLQPGEILQNGGNEQVKVLQCRAVSYGRECQTVSWKNGRPDSNPAWWDEEMLIKGDARVREALGMPSRSGAAAVAPNPPRAAAPAARRTAPAAQGRPATVPQRAAAAGRIPDGAYRCQMWSGSSYVSLGTVRSVDGRLNTDLLGKVGATFTGATPTADGVTINYTTARGYRESMDCKRT